MLPSELHDFLLACVGASASFIGLLFVALSVVLQKTDDIRITENERLQAQSAYSALINVFFVTLVGLIPGANVGPVCLVMAILGLLSCWRARALSHPAPLIISALVYAGEAVFAFFALGRNDQIVSTGNFQIVIFALLSLSLFRAWELTGVRKK